MNELENGCRNGCSVDKKFTCTVIIPLLAPTFGGGGGEAFRIARPPCPLPRSHSTADFVALPRAVPVEQCRASQDQQA